MTSVLVLYVQEEEFFECKITLLSLLFVCHLCVLLKSCYFLYWLFPLLILSFIETSFSIRLTTLE